NPSNKRGESTIRENPIKATSQTGKKNNTTPLNGKKKHGKNNNKTKTTKHTIEFSTNTPALQATLPLYCKWTETSNPVLQSYWPGAVGFSPKSTPLSGFTQSGPARATPPLDDPLDFRAQTDQ